MWGMEKTVIVDKYWKHLLTEGVRPKSVFAFTESLGIEEREFYEHCSGLDAIERDYWASTVEDTIDVLEKDDDFQQYPVDQKLLAFFFTYITHVQKHRSRLVNYFPKMAVMETEKLKPMQHSFEAFMKAVVASGVEEGTFADRKKLTESYDKLLWLHFLAVIRFYIKDESDGFQDTDAFIEKSLKLGVQTATHGVLDSGFDLLRFLVGKDEKLSGLSKMMSKFIPKK